MLHNT
jgi:hypothetical protein